MLAPPFGESPNGLKVDEAREAVALLRSTPVGDLAGVVVVGPMDRAAPKSADTLLKIVEEPTAFAVPILWAHDLGGVQATIRSRCLDLWSPPTGREVPDTELESTARELIRAHMNGSFWEIPGLVKKMEKRESELLGEVADALTANLVDPRHQQLWERVRLVAQWHNPQQVEVISAFLPLVP